MINTELTLLGAVNDKSDVDFAENIIITVINKAIKKVGGDDGDYPKIRKAVEKLLEEIANLPDDMEVLQAENKCIILKFRCISEAFQNILDELADSINTIPEIKSGPFKIDAIVTAACLKDILDGLSLTG